MLLALLVQETVKNGIENYNNNNRSNSNSNNNNSNPYKNYSTK